ncbi:GD20648 [Drosophila simulans]|uniref:GD20648 n=1 Tax=Drosophila simulans TaxID=7240 RepID=B4QTN7_DROSI|nr:GD20648 [Drosophila simulans]
MRMLKTKLIGQVSELAGQVVCRILSLGFSKKLRKTEEEVVHGRIRGWDPYPAKVKQARLESGSERDSPAISSLAPLRVFPPPTPSPSKTSRPSLSAQAWPIQ